MLKISINVRKTCQDENVLLTCKICSQYNEILKSKDFHGYWAHFMQMRKCLKTYGFSNELSMSQKERNKTN